MKSELFTIACLVALSNSAHATIISSETGTSTFTTQDSFMVSCAPGLPSNGHNYPAESSLMINYVNEFVPDATVSQLAYIDGQVGDHCADLTHNFAALIPEAVKTSRTIDETFVRASYTVCVRHLEEMVTLKIGSTTFTGVTEFNADPVDMTKCQP
jgi:hypothetical protein